MRRRTAWLMYTSTRDKMLKELLNDACFSERAEEDTLLLLLEETARILETYGEKAIGLIWALWQPVARRVGLQLHPAEGFVSTSAKTIAAEVAREPALLQGHVNWIREVRASAHPLELAEREPSPLDVDVTSRGFDTSVGEK